MQKLLDGYGTALSFVRGGARLLSLVPGLKGVCDEIRGLLDDAEGGGELAQDVLDFIELVLEAADHLFAVAKAAEKAGGDVQRELEKPMNALRKVLANGRKAVAEFSARGVLSALFAAAKTARSLRRLARTAGRAANARGAEGLAQVLAETVGGFTRHALAFHPDPMLFVRNNVSALSFLFFPARSFSSPLSSCRSPSIRTRCCL